MICRRPLGRVADDTPGVDWVDVSWPQTLRRAVRLVSRGGTRIDVLLPPGGRLAHGDVLAAGDGPRAVWVEEIGVLSMAVREPLLLGRLAFHLGNLHLPTQVVPGGLLTPDDGPARAAAEQFGVPFGPARARFYPEPVTPDRLFAVRTMELL